MFVVLFLTLFSFNAHASQDVQREALSRQEVRVAFAELSNTETSDNASDKSIAYSPTQKKMLKALNEKLWKNALKMQKLEEAHAETGLSEAELKTEKDKNSESQQKLIVGGILQGLHPDDIMCKKPLYPTQIPLPYSALQEFVQKGDLFFVRYLLEHKADPLKNAYLPDPKTFVFSSKNFIDGDVSRRASITQLLMNNTAGNALRDQQILQNSMTQREQLNALIFFRAVHNLNPILSGKVLDTTVERCWQTAREIDLFNDLNSIVPELPVRVHAIIAQYCNNVITQKSIWRAISNVDKELADLYANYDQQVKALETAALKTSDQSASCACSCTVS